MRSKTVDSAVNPLADRQIKKFKEAARQLGTDDDSKRFKEWLAALVKHKPVEKPE